MFGSTGEFDYKEADGKATLTKYTGGAKQVIIPAEVDGFKVVGFGKIFGYNDNLEFVDIPCTVEKISDEAFYGCKNLKTVKLGDGIKIIGAYAFAYCSALNEIDIPSSVEVLERYAFGSSGLESVTLRDGLKKICESAFHASKLKSVTIPDSVKAIEYFAFCDTRLTDVHIGHGVMRIEPNTFGDTPVERVAIPSSVNCIEEKAFNGCKSLKSATFEDPSGMPLSAKVLSNPAKAAKLLRKGKKIV